MCFRTLTVILVEDLFLEGTFIFASSELNCMSIITDLIQGHFELGGSLLVDIIESDRVILVHDIGDGHEPNPVGLRAGRGVGRCGDIKVRVVHKHADVLKTERHTHKSLYADASLVQCRDTQ